MPGPRKPSDVVRFQTEVKVRVKYGVIDCLNLDENRERIGS
jgi:hypothetical protein